MQRKIKIALVGAGMFGGDVHARAYTDLQRSGISPQLGRVGLDHWAKSFADIDFELSAVATRSEASARRAQNNYKKWTGFKPQAFWGKTPWLDILRKIPDIDIVAVATPDNLHTEVILSALKAKAHVVTENVAMYALLRCKVLTDGALQHQLAGQLLIGFGLVSVVVAAFFLSRQKDVKRMFAYSSIEHMGLIAFAFGLGGPIATFAGLLHMTVHSLTKSAIFFAVGHATQKAGTQVMSEIRGLIKVSPTVGWGMMLGSLAILGMPPFGVFASEFLILTTAMREQPWATPFLLLALGVAFASVFSRVLPMVFGETTVKPLAHAPALLPVFTHLALGLMLGVWVPPYLVGWYTQAARMVAG